MTVLRRRLVEGTTYVSLDDLLALLRARADGRRRNGLYAAGEECDQLADDVVSAWLANSARHLEG